MQETAYNIFILYSNAITGPIYFICDNQIFSFPSGNTVLVLVFFHCGDSSEVLWRCVGELVHYLQLVINRVENTGIHFVFLVVELQVVDAVTDVLNVPDVERVVGDVTFVNVNGLFKSVAYVEERSVFVVGDAVRKHEIFRGN